MLIVSILAFFVVIFLLASITVTVAWMGFLKTTAEQTDAARRDLEVDAPEAGAEDSRLFHSERFSTLNFYDSLLTRFNFGEILKLRIAQADMDWSVGRVTLAMLLMGTVALLIMLKLVVPLGALAIAGFIGFAPYGYILRRR